jgi:hypothetical protein
MTNGQIRDLCLALLHAETESEVVEVLKKAGYWDSPAAWRYYGDVENNWGQSGNQQSLAEAALAEKLVNSVDARLINECLVRGIDPKSDKAPDYAFGNHFPHSTGITGPSKSAARLFNPVPRIVESGCEHVNKLGIENRRGLNEFQDFYHRIPPGLRVLV